MSSVSNLAFAFSVAAIIRLGFVFLRHSELRTQAAALSLPLSFNEAGHLQSLAIPLVFALAAFLLGSVSFYKKAARRGIYLGAFVWLVVLVLFGTRVLTAPF